MIIRKHNRNSLPHSLKANPVSKKRNLTIEIFNHESPSHKHPPKTLLPQRKTPIVHKSQFPNTTKEKVLKPIKPKSNFFIFPPESKSPQNTVKSPKQKNPALPANLQKKTPFHKINKRKLLKRPKTTINTDLLAKPENSLAQVVSQVPLSPSQSNQEIYNEHLFLTFQGLKIARSIPPVDLEQLKQKRITVPRRRGYENKKTVIFDLDETLVHCCQNSENTDPDVVLPVKFPTGEILNAAIKIRPHVYECLNQVNKDFEVFVFTASHKCYADVILDYLDPTGDLIHQRFYRENCINMNGIFIKDLRVFSNRKLSDIVIVDNASYSYAYQIDNGVPIITWHSDKEDQELLNLICYLQTLVQAEDIRDINYQAFHLRTFYDDYIKEYSIQHQ